MSLPIILDAMLRLPESRLTDQQLSDIKRRLTLRLPDSSAFGFGPAGASTLEVWRHENGYVSIPRNYDLAREICRSNQVEDQRSRGDPIDVTSNTRFRTGQVEFVDELVAAVQEDGLGTIGMAPCGFGKSLCGVNVAARLGRTTLIVVHKEPLMAQWAETIRRTFGVEPGFVQGDVCDYQGRQFVIAMIQSLYQRDYGQDFYRWAGVVIHDETHRVAAPCFTLAIEKIHAYYRIGLTATPRRSDKLENVFFWHIGGIGVEGSGHFLDCSVFSLEFDPQIPQHSYTWKGKANLARLINKLAEHSGRTDLLVGHLFRAVSAGRRILGLSDRIEHLEEIKRRLTHRIGQAGLNKTVGIFRAGSAKAAQAEREAAAQADVTLGSYGIAQEGLDLPAHDTVFLLTPKADVEQSVGRIRRIHDGKKPPLVVDVSDSIPLLGRFTSKRVRYYTTVGADKGCWPVKFIEG